MTDPIPKDAIAAGPNVDPEVVKKLTKSFENMTDSDAAVGSIMKGIKINGFVDTHDGDYDVVRKAAAHS